MTLMGAQSLITAKQAEHHSAYLSSMVRPGVSVFRCAKELGGHWAVPGARPNRECRDTHLRDVCAITALCIRITRLKFLESLRKSPGKEGRQAYTLGLGHKACSLGTGVVPRECRGAVVSSCTTAAQNGIHETTLEIQINGRLAVAINC